MAGRGGRRPNTGGARPGAGRKLDASALRLREWYRERLWRDREKHYKLALRHAQNGDTAFLAKLYDKVLPTPTEIDVNLNRIPADFVFRAVLTQAGGVTPPASVAVPDAHRGKPRD